ncbi:MAG: YHS domain-containing protein, partial [Deltaproteobacteria bacterium]|nr:YHS domain-containing protein [Deltaproteobacteria bacterium]
MNTHHEHKTTKQHKEHDTTVDPVCGMDVKVSSASHKYEHKGKFHYFCSGHCLTKFKENPEKFIGHLNENQAEDEALDSQEFKDPVCGMTTNDPDEYKKHVYKGNTYHLCSEHCLTKFKDNPEKFISEEYEQSVEDHKHGIMYTCPMDPEIVRDHPGSCPKCGMALEPMTSSLSDTRTEYTCPMHPEIVKDEPGN